MYLKTFTPKVDEIRGIVNDINIQYENIEKLE
jgi:hypothetical protein